MEEALRSLQWIERCEENFRRQLNRVVQSVLAQPNLKIICMTGPTCSGKTTVAKLLVSHLNRAGKTVHTISLDDFYYDKSFLHQSAEDSADGRVDYDSVKTINLSALKTFLSEFSGGNCCRCPIYDFPTGKRVGYRTIACRKEDIFIFEGIQILYPEVSALLRDYVSLGIYIVPQSPVESFGQIFESNEIRLLRRLVRDSNFRSTAAEDTFSMWEGVRSNEEANIFPYVREEFLRIDSTMPYEIGVLKPYLCRILPTVPADSKYRSAAEAILEKLQDVPAISSDLIPADSLYQEFI